MHAQMRCNASGMSRALASLLMMSVFSWAVCGWGNCFASEPSLAVAVALDARHTISVRLSGLSGPVAFEPVPGYPRETLWRIDASDGQMSGDTVTPAPGKRVITLLMDVSKPLPRPDRTYAPFLRVSEDSVVVLHQLFVPMGGANVAFKATKTGRCTGGRTYAANTMDSSGEGYILLGDFKCVGGDGYTVIYADAAAEVLAGKVAAEVGSISRFYTRVMGERKDFSVIVYLSLDPDARPSWFHGDSLGNGLTLGFSRSAEVRNWDEYGPNTPAGFLAHEVFHQWNGSSAVRAAGNSFTLATEGGAEVASLFYSQASGKKEFLDTWDFLIARTNACIASVGFGRSVAEAMHRDPLARLPYDCGAVWSLIASKDAKTPTPPGFFSMWKNVVAQSAKTSVSLDGLCGDNCLDARSFLETKGIASRVAEIFQVSASQPISMDQSEQAGSAVFSQIFMQLMQADCEGQFGFTQNLDALKPDVRVTSCKSLSVLKKVTALAGLIMHERPNVIVAGVKQSCERTGFVSVRGSSRPDTTGGADEIDVRIPCPFHLDDSAGFLSPLRR